MEKIEVPVNTIVRIIWDSTEHKRPIGSINRVCLVEPGTNEVWVPSQDSYEELATVFMPYEDVEIVMLP